MQIYVQPQKIGRDRSGVDLLEKCAACVLTFSFFSKLSARGSTSLAVVQYKQLQPQQVSVPGDTGWSVCSLLDTFRMGIILMTDQLVTLQKNVSALVLSVHKFCDKFHFLYLTVYFSLLSVIHA